MKKKRKSHKKLILSILGVIVLVVAAVLVGVLARNMVERDDSPGSPEPEAPSLPASVEDVQNLRSQGDDDESNKKIEEALKDQSTNRETRYMLYIQQGHIAYDKQDWNEAIEAYGEAEGVKRTTETSELLANTYVEVGDKEKAIEYFKEAIRLTPLENPRYEAIKDGFEMRIEQLGGRS